MVALLVPTSVMRAQVESDCDFVDECGVCEGEGIVDLNMISTWVSGTWSSGDETTYTINGVSVNVVATSSNANYAVRDQILAAINANTEVQAMGVTARSGGRTYPSSPDTQADPPLGWGEIELLSAESISFSASWNTAANGMIQGSDGSYSFVFTPCDCEGNGALDECGVCDGPGAIYECGCSDIPEGDCDCDGNVVDQCGVCGGEGIVDLNMISTWVSGTWSSGDETTYTINGVSVNVVATSSNANYAVRDQILAAINANTEVQAMGVTARSGGRTYPSSPDTQADPPLGWGEIELLSAESISFSASWNTAANGMIQGSDGSYSFVFTPCDCEGNGALDECGVCDGPGAIYECGCSDIPEGDCDCDGNVVDQCEVCGGDGSSCVGCMDAAAVNFAPTATIDDSNSCVYSFETLEEYYLLGYTDGVNSVECPDVQDGSACASDFDNDGEIATGDLLTFLSTFGQSCE